MKSYALRTLPSITALALILLANPLHAQSVGQARVVGTCGTASYTAGENGPVTIDTTGDGCIAGSITASLAGFTPNGSVATLAVTNSSGNVALPSGTVVAVANTGSVDASIKLSVGAGTAATTDFILKAGATAGLTVGSNTFINAITAASTTTLSLAGGSGLVTGFGGGGGGGTITGVAQGSTTSGQTVVPVGCRTLTSAPTDTTAQTNMPSCDTAGALRVNVTSATGVAQGSTTSGQTVSPIGCRTLTSAPTDTTAQTNMPWCTTKGSLVAAQPTAADLNATVVGTGTFAVQAAVSGVAQGSTTSGQTVVPMGCRTLTTTPTDTTAQTNMPVCNARGNQVVSPYALPDVLVQGTTAAMTGTTSTSLLGVPGSGLFNYITTLSCVNSHATVGTFVTVQDGSGGTAIWTVAAASVFGGTVVTFPAPLKQPTSNTALFVADVTTGANVICSASGYKAP